jgi:trimeric autotransporter adhesin
MPFRFVPHPQFCKYALALLFVSPLLALAGAPVDDKPALSHARLSPDTVFGASGPNLQFIPTVLNIIAGTFGTSGDTGNPGPAISALIHGGDGVAFDASGNLYFSDFRFNVVRKIDTSGNLSTFAGIETDAPGHGGFSGDNGPATSAELDDPEQLAFDSNGNLYIADSDNSIIRKVDTSGTITTFAGHFDNNFGGFSGDGGPATSAFLSFPRGLAVDASNNVYIADTNNNVIRIVNTSGIINTFAGNSNGTGGSTGDGGPATSALLNTPRQVATDLAGNLFIADSFNNKIRKVDAGGIISTYAGNGLDTGSSPTGVPGPAAAAGIQVEGVATDSVGNLYIVSNTEVFLVDASQNISFFAGGGAGTPVSGIPATHAGIGATGDAVDADGNLYVSDVINHVLYRIGPNGILEFGNQDVNVASAPLAVTLRNTGSSALTFNAIPDTISGDFAIVAGGTCDFTAGLASGATCTVEVTFTPLSAAALTGTISFSTNAPGSPQLVQLFGTGIASSAPAATLTPATLAFGNQTTGTTTVTPLVATLSNSGTVTLNISGISIAGANPTDFSQSSTTCGSTLAAGSSCTISVTFTPPSATTFNATLDVADNAAGSPQSTSLTGTGVASTAPQAVLRPSSLAFGNQNVITSSTAQTVTLSNPGTATLTVTGITLGGSNPNDFAQTATSCGATLAASASCTISVDFTPASAASVSATLVVADNASGSPQSANLSGTGVTPAAADFTVSSSTPSQTITAGGVAVYAIAVSSVSSSSPFTSPVTLTASGLPPSATGSFGASPVTPGSSGATTMLTVQTAAGTATFLPPPTSVRPLAPPLARYPATQWFTPTASLALLCFGLFARRKRWPPARPIFLVVAFLGLCIVNLSGCNGGFALPGSRSTLYTITVTGTSGSVQHSTTVVLTVNK